MTELTDRDLPGLTLQTVRQEFEALAVRCGWDLAQAHGGGVTRWLDPMTRDLYLSWLERQSSAMADKHTEIAALKAEIEDLKGRLTSIGDLAHDTSTGPATHDTYWEIRSMAYEAVQPIKQGPK